MLYPCSSLSRGAARKSIDRFVGRGEHFWGCNTPVWVGCAAARAGRGEQARDLLRHFYQSFTPGSQGGFALVYDYHRTGRGLSHGPAVFVLESTMGYSAVLPEMMLQSHNGCIEVFPAVPKDWKNVLFDNLRARGAFLVSAMRKAGRATEVQIMSERGGTVRLKNPWPHRPKVVANGRRLIPKIQNGILTWETKPRATYRLSRPTTASE
jgi:hypothetical protein